MPRGLRWLLVCAVLPLLLVFLTTPIFAAQPTALLWVYGRPMGVFPVVDHELMVPLRDVGEALGLTVTWEDNRVLLQGERTLRITLAGNKAHVEGEQARSFRVHVEDGKTLVPLRAIAELLGESIVWDGNLRAAYIGEVVQEVKIGKFRFVSPPQAREELLREEVPGGTYRLAGFSKVRVKQLHQEFNGDKFWALPVYAMFWLGPEWFDRMELQVYWIPGKAHFGESSILGAAVPRKIVLFSQEPEKSFLHEFGHQIEFAYMGNWFDIENDAWSTYRQIRSIQADMAGGNTPWSERVEEIFAEDFETWLDSYNHIYTAKKKPSQESLADYGRMMKELLQWEPAFDSPTCSVLATLSGNNLIKAWNAAVAKIAAVSNVPETRSMGTLWVARQLTELSQQLGQPSGWVRHFIKMAGLSLADGRKAQLACGWLMNWFSAPAEYRAALNF